MKYLKLIVALVVFQLMAAVLFAQTDSNITPAIKAASLQKRTDTSAKKVNKFKDTVTTDSSIIATVDSLFIKDSLAKLTVDSLRKDSLAKATAIKQKSNNDTSTYASVLNHPFLPFNQPPVYEIMQARPPTQNDELFYLLAATVLLIAVIKIVSPKYFQNIFGIFFQTSFRQKHTRDQLLQYKMASLGMNFFFLVTGGLYIALLSKQLQLVSLNFWWLLLYCFLLLLIVYVVKYLFLIFSGWIFNVREAANTYVFIVFLVNKITGIILLPIVLLLAFAGGGIYVQTIITVSLIIVGLLLLYRYIASVGTVRRDLKINAIHFFLYLCTVEIMPLLLMYKLLFNYIGAS